MGHGNHAFRVDPGHRGNCSSPLPGPLPWARAGLIALCHPFSVAPCLDLASLFRRETSGAARIEERRVTVPDLRARRASFERCNANRAGREVEVLRLPDRAIEKGAVEQLAAGAHEEAAVAE